MKLLKPEICTLENSFKKHQYPLKNYFEFIPQSGKVKEIANTIVHAKDEVFSKVSWNMLAHFNRCTDVMYRCLSLHNTIRTQHYSVNIPITTCVRCVHSSVFKLVRILMIPMRFMRVCRAAWCSEYSLVPNIRPDGIKDPKDIFPEI